MLTKEIQRNGPNAQKAQVNVTRALIRPVLDRNDNSHDDEKHHQRKQTHELDILPPHLALETPAAHPELSRAAPETVRLVHQQIQALAALEKTLNVLCHDASHVVNLAARVADGVVAATARGTIVHHEVLELRVERRRAVVGHVGEVAALGELLEEALADLEQEAKRHPTAER